MSLAPNPDVKKLICHTSAIHPDFQTPLSKVSRTHDPVKDSGW